MELIQLCQRTDFRLLFVMTGNPIIREMCGNDIQTVRIRQISYTICFQTVLHEPCREKTVFSSPEPKAHR